jgi:hypothetical protein
MVVDIEVPLEQVQLSAVKQNGLFIEFIKNPSEEVQLAAVTKNGDSIFISTIHQKMLN